MMDSQREHPAERPTIPADLVAPVEGYHWMRVTVGQSGDAVHRLYRPGTDLDLYLKQSTAATLQDVAGEYVRLLWLAGRIAVPVVRSFISTPDQAWLLTTALPGRTARQLLDSNPGGRPAIVEAIARLIRRLHEIPVELCPFNSDHRLRLMEARWRIDHGLVDVEGFDRERAGWTAEQVWTEMAVLLPSVADPVVTHGDLSFDNILLADGNVAGLIDVGRAGIADRYQDLAIVWRELADFGPALQRQFLRSYGVELPDHHKIRFHVFLDDLF